MHSSKHTTNLLILCVGCALSGILAIFMGQDISWDLRNYHFYNGFALLNNRIGFDIAPAGIQTYINPILDIPFFLLSLKFNPISTAIIIGIFQGLVFYFVYQITKKLLKKEYPGYILLITSLSAITTPIFLGELGTSYGDIVVSIPVLMSIYCFLSKTNSIDSQLSGVMTGLALGLKLTVAPFYIGFVVAIFLTRREYLFRWVLFSIIGFIITSSYWMYIMYVNYDSPLFPFYNEIFQSSFYQLINFEDRREVPETILATLTTPFRWNLFFSGNIQDLRFGFAIFLIFILLLYIYKNKKNKLNENEKFILIFYVASFLIWAYKFSIYRYLAPLILISPIIITFILVKINSRNGIVLLISIILIISTNISNFSERIAWRNDYFGVNEEALKFPKSDGLVLLINSGNPNSYITPYLPNNFRIIRVGDGEWGSWTQNLFGKGSKFNGLSTNMINNHRGEIYLITSVDDMEENTSIIKNYNLKIIKNSLVKPSKLDKSLQLYRLVKVN